jgi:serine/threonine protein kinase
LKQDGGVRKLKSFTFDILQGLYYLHSLGIIHMDIKPGNLLLNVDVQEDEFPMVKICDFGLARRVDSNRGCFVPKKCGTEPYIAPEVADGAYVSTAVDMWSVGILLHVLAVGYYPTVLKWKPGQDLPMPPRYWRKYKDTGLQELIIACLKLNPQERITAAQAIESVWIVS